MSISGKVALIKLWGQNNNNNINDDNDNNNDNVNDNVSNNNNFKKLFFWVE